MFIRNVEHLLTGFVFLLVGTFFGAYGLLFYETGTIEEMGPGWFPFFISFGLMVLGVIQVLRSIATTTYGVVSFEIARPIFITALIIGMSYAWPYIGAATALGLIMSGSGLLNPKYELKWFLVSWLFIIALLVAFKYGLGMSVVIWN